MYVVIRIPLEIRCHSIGCCGLAAPSIEPSTRPSTGSTWAIIRIVVKSQCEGVGLTGHHRCLGLFEKRRESADGLFLSRACGPLIGARGQFCNLTVVSDLLLFAPSPHRRLQSFLCFFRSQSLPQAPCQTSVCRADQAFLPNGVNPSGSTVWSSEDLVLCQINSQDHAGRQVSRARMDSCCMICITCLRFLGPLVLFLFAKFFVPRCLPVHVSLSPFSTLAPSEL
ncbi:uncharacterized protein BO80DRAFT_204240 [Aspergillus ibericus CBS 121593]|uniref:Uncharacterized protein n=1 Tax=Aspergillus ibericus CBS 121593 TaxID=1448316 RepID=A0A395HAJ5_9EURO|nr:hypothetical protein BO80DRAFT_204240 [Aspergillus ibericus CBS 121593]RAL04599.1 hypothetical protein BO80DRAFT_204240 [Aspergillus ibericus CBS 121593]